MNQKEVSVILDKMVERTRVNPAASGAGAFELYMNIHEMKKEVANFIIAKAKQIEREKKLNELGI